MGYKHDVKNAVSLDARAVFEANPEPYEKTCAKDKRIHSIETR